MAINANIVQIRKRLCLRCKNQCPEYKAGELNHEDACTGCPIGVWHSFEDAGCPQPEITPAEPEQQYHHGSPELAKEPGSLLKWMIWKLTGVLPCPKCDRRAQEMNEWGWLGCWRNRRKIYEWLTHEANSRGHQIDEATLQALLLAGLRELKHGK